MSIFGKSFPELQGFGALVSALLALVNNTLGGREDMEGERKRERDRRNKGDGEKKCLYPVVD